MAFPRNLDTDPGHEQPGGSYGAAHVNPFAVKQTKELTDNTPTKSDAKDALVIAKLARDGTSSAYAILPVLPNGVVDGVVPKGVAGQERFEVGPLATVRRPRTR